VLPDRFIPFSEENGLIGQIGEHVLRTACARSVGWAPLKLAVNLSPIQVRTPRLPDLIANILIETGFEAQHLELEITENTLLEDTDTVLSTLGSLKALGVTIAMDDFGIGYSSLGYLRRFPFDRLKIDRSFVKDIGDDPHSGAIAKAVIAMGHSLGIATTAEGVETPMQAKILRRLGCHELQGFLFGRPMPADDFERFVGNQEAARKARRQRPSRLRDGHYSPPHAEPIGRRNEAR
jgi:EAL domain-containing protein (putative c-di-GMP-specific phosphodiesterase class I)